MNIQLKLFLGICIFLSQISFGQTLKTLGMEGKLKKTEHVLSDIITIIPAGESVKIISGPVSGVYFVDYNGQQGYINEIYFSKPSISSNYAVKQKWDEYSLKEYWNTNIPDEIEGIYLRKSRSTLFIDNRQMESHNKVAVEKYYIIKDGENYILSSFSEEFKGKLIKVSNLNKYFLEINSSIWGGSGFVTMNLIRNNVSELSIDNFQLYVENNVYLILKDEFSMIWRPENAEKNKRKSLETGF